MFGYDTETHEPSWGDVEYSDPLNAASYQVICTAENGAANELLDTEVAVLTL